jgi:hypothetical protein
MQPFIFAVRHEPALLAISGYGKTDLPTAPMIASDRISRECDAGSLHDAMDQIFPTGSEVAGTLLGVYAGGEVGAHAGAATGALDAVYWNSRRRGCGRHCRCIGGGLGWRHYGCEVGRGRCQRHGLIRWFTRIRPSATPSTSTRRLWKASSVALRGYPPRQ